MSECDKSSEQEAIINVIGIGKTGLRAVGKMAGNIHNVNCLGVGILSHNNSVENEIPIEIPIVMLPEHDRDFDPLLSAIEPSDLIFLIAKLGEGYDDCLADICTAIRKHDILIVPVILEPEDVTTRFNAPFGLRATVDCMIIVDESSFVSHGPCFPTIIDENTLPDHLLRLAIEKITDIIAHQSLMSVDFLDFKRIVKGNGLTRLGTGYASGSDKGVSATDTALSSIKRQGVSLKEIPRMLCHISGSSEMTMDDYNGVNRQIHKAVTDETLVIIGVTENKELKDNIMVTILAAGV